MEAGNGDLENRFCAEQLPAVCVSGDRRRPLMHAIGAGAAEARARRRERDARGDELERQRRAARAASWPRRAASRPRPPRPRAPPRCERQRQRATGRCSRSRRRWPARDAAALDRVPLHDRRGGDDAGGRRVHRGRGARRARSAQIRAAIDLDMFGVGGKLKLVELGLWPDTEPIPHTEWLMRRLEARRRRARLRRRPDDGDLGRRRVRPLHRGRRARGLVLEARTTSTTTRSTTPSTSSTATRSRRSRTSPRSRSGGWRTRTSCRARV